ncbi:MAG: tRNA epoxyqueuosine(34) reductase QueG [Alphaproteobacteria bacterium]
MTQADLTAAIKDKAREFGFDAVGIAPARVSARDAERLDTFVANGEYGDMAWMKETLARRRDPQTLWPDAKSVIMLAMNYGPDTDPMDKLDQPEIANISCYAQNRDYHDVIKKRLKRLARWLIEQAGGDVKVFVDTAPVMEKPLGAAAGIGWQGKHSNLVSRELGSWFFLGSVFTTLELKADPLEVDHCGSCRACLDICPTDAFPAPHTLDARRCISYLTIEHKGHIPREFRSKMGNRIYGCDDCLAVCPWNKFAEAARETAFVPREDLTAPTLLSLVGMDDAAFRTFFSGSPVKRIGRDRFIRNVLIALGNSDDADAAPAIEPLLGDGSPLVRAMAVWALGKLLDEPAFNALKSFHAASESDPTVAIEWVDARP